jgi:hypothetical protein
MSNREKVAAIRAEHPRLAAGQIAKHIGVSRQYVAMLLKELGLPTSVQTRAPREPGAFHYLDNRKRLETLYRRFDGICQYCGVQCERNCPDVGRQPSLDRVVAYTKGGKYFPENETLACRRCNSTKGNKTADEARHRIALQCLGWPNMSREAVAWLKTQGVDTSAYERFRFKFERD